MKCHHYCNCELSCPECIKRFWKWAENHTRGRPGRRTQNARRDGNTVLGSGGVGTEQTFYEAAAKRIR